MGIEENVLPKGSSLFEEQSEDVPQAKERKPLTDNYKASGIVFLGKWRYKEARGHQEVKKRKCAWSSY